MYLRSGGRLVCVGMPGNNAAVTAPIVLLITKVRLDVQLSTEVMPMFYFALQRLHIIGSYVGCVPPFLVMREKS
jgi:hypothetical protein